VNATLHIAKELLLPGLLMPELLKPGQRVGVAVSGGADSVALLRILHEQRATLGLVLSVLHVHHGIREHEADEDAAFVEQLSAMLDLPCEVFSGAARVRAAEYGETLEEAARKLRYGFFERELTAGRLDAVATGHTRDDQAETVLMKLLRGAWTEGLSGVHPVVSCGRGRIVRPLLRLSRAEIEAYLNARGQGWREDSSNRDPAFTRNRVRHQLLPALRTYNPQIDGQLARMATVARDEEAWWSGELGRVLPQLLLPGKPTRGGGRSTSARPEDASLSIEVERLRRLHPAMRRRVLRAAGQRLGLVLGVDAIERLLELAGMVGPVAEPAAQPVGGGEPTGGGGAQPSRDPGSSDLGPRDPGTPDTGPREGRSGQRMLSLPGGWMAERTVRELRFARSSPRGRGRITEEYAIPVPGSAEGAAFGLQVTAKLLPSRQGVAGEVAGEVAGGADGEWQGGALTLRAWRPGDRVTLRHSRGPKKVKEVLERLKVTGVERESWPVVAAEGAAGTGGSVLWMRGVEVEPTPGLGLKVRDVRVKEQSSAEE
jgi:tRNA(Ile)-lysidine synthase